MCQYYFEGPSINNKCHVLLEGKIIRQQLLQLNYQCYEQATENAWAEKSIIYLSFQLADKLFCTLGSEVVILIVSKTLSKLT